MTNSGTRYAGISTSGNCAIGPVVTSPVTPEARAELSPPTLTATTRYAWAETGTLSRAGFCCGKLR